MDIIPLGAFFIVCPLVFLASFVDAVAGGGGLISLPAYLLAGVPVHSAIATNKLSSATGTVISTVRYCRNGYVSWPLAFPGIAAALAGSALGANLALRASDQLLKLMLIFVLPVAAFYVLRRKKGGETEIKKRSRGRVLAVVTAASLIIGMYDGFYGPGTGTFLLLVFTGMAGMDVKTASGNVKLVNLTSNCAALGTFLFSGNVLVPLGLCASVFSIFGHYLGAGMVMKNGAKIVRPIILVVLLLLFVKILGEFIV